MRSRYSVAELSAAWHRDPFWAALTAAVAIHLIVIFGVRFEADTSPIQRNQLAVTVALNPIDETPANARHVAAANQSGAADSANPTVTLAATQLSIAADNEGSASDDAGHRSDTLREQIEALAEDIAALSDGEATAASRAGSVAARRSLDAAYLARWRARVEQVGNSLYGELTRSRGDGDVRLLVTVDARGNLEDARIIRSSGNTALDLAALATVRRAAPFPPFPKELAEVADRLEIVRTWQFRSQPLSSP